MTTPWFSFDIDDTIAEFNAYAHRMFNQHLGTNHNPEDGNYDLLEKFGFEPSEMWRLFYDLGICANQEPTIGVVGALQDLHAAGAKIQFVTGREQLRDALRVTQTWLVQHEIPFDDLCIVHRDQSKVQFLHPGTVAFFEDTVRHLSDASDVDARVVVTRPWNRGKLHFSHFRIWPHDVGSMIDQLRKQYVG